MSNTWANTAQSEESTNDEKNTYLRFGWMKEGHYYRTLYRDVDFKEDEWKPKLYVSKEDNPKLWYLMEVLENMDFDMDAIKCIILRLSFWTIKDNFWIEYYWEQDKKLGQGKYAWEISILELKPEEVVELVKSKILEAQEAESVL